tara:strand:- start:52 stop:435 length:384 start_codon:yes stop_codon:yes gene_type:complete
METIILVVLLLSILYLIFAVRDMRADIDDLEYRLELLTEVCNRNKDRIKLLEYAEAREANRRKGANKYSRLLEIAISKCIIYCYDGWAVSKTLLSKVKSKAYRIFEGSIRPAYIRAKQNVLRTVYRA